MIERRDDPCYQQARIMSDVILGDAVLEGDNFVGQNVELHGNVSLGFKSTIGHHSILFGGDIRIGRYCQFGPYVALYAKNDPSEYMTTYVNKRLFNGELQKHNVSLPIHVGHDVWIGQGAVVLKGVNIGNGAIVGASSIVTKDIPDYGIVAGNPAHLLRKRFDDEIIELLSNLKWWNKTPEQINQMKALFFTNFQIDRDASVELLKSYLT